MRTLARNGLNHFVPTFLFTQCCGINKEAHQFRLTLLLLTNKNTYKLSSNNHAISKKGYFVCQIQMYRILMYHINGSTVWHYIRFHK